MAIIDTSYFKNDIFIPLAEGTISGTDNPDNEAALTDMIDQIEKSLLLNALGFEAYWELQDALVDIDNAEPKWKWLVNGLNYNGKVWDGLKDSKSLIAYAVYFFFLSNDSKGFYNAVGVSKPDSENAQMVTPQYKLVSAWQQFIDKYQRGYFLNPLYIPLNGMEFWDWYGQQNNIEVSMYQFLNDHASLYGFDSSKFRSYIDNVNSFGI